MGKRKRHTIRTVDLWEEGIAQVEQLRANQEIWRVFEGKIPSVSQILRMAVDNLAIRVLLPEAYADTRKAARERYGKADRL